MLFIACHHTHIPIITLSISSPDSGSHPYRLKRLTTQCISIDLATVYTACGDNVLYTVTIYYAVPFITRFMLHLTRSRVFNSDNLFEWQRRACGLRGCAACRHWPNDLRCNRTSPRTQRVRTAAAAVSAPQCRHRRQTLYMYATVRAANM